MRILKAVYCITTDETTIYFKRFIYGKEREDFKIFKGKIKKKGKNPTEEEVFKFIELKGGLKK